jgi:hypothetical protein
MITFCSIAACAKDKPTFRIQVVGTDAWQRDVSIYHPATNSTSSTNCDTNGTVDDNTYGNTTNGSLNAQTNCTTTTKPGSPAYVSHGNIQQESVHAIFPNGRHVTLWCQAGFRKCDNLAAGTYEAEPDGDEAVRIYVYSPVSHKLMGKVKYRVAGFWQNNSGNDSDAYRPVTKADLQIVQRAREILNDPSKWDQADTRKCSDDAQTFSLYCSLEKATKEVSGSFQHYGPAMQEARFVVGEIAPNRNYHYPLMDYNNDPATTFRDIQRVFDLMEKRITNQLREQ